MKSDLLIYRKLEEIHTALLAHDIRTIDRLDKIDAQLKLLLKGESKFVTAELEAIIKQVAARALSIDAKVSDD